MNKALIIALCSSALVLSGLSVAQTTGNSFQSTVISSQTQDVAQKTKCKKGSKKSCKKMKSRTSKHHASRAHRHQQRQS